MEIRQALNRVTYGVRQEDIEAVETITWQKWVQKQLALEENDSKCDQLIKDIAYSLSYTEKGKEKEKNLSLFRYYATAGDIWKSVHSKNDPPRYLIEAGAVETGLVTWTKAIYSKNQLFEMVVEFWHNHFNVSVETDDAIAALFPIYDREVIRENALGNFRKFTEDVAKSPCMLLYLDNAFSQASPANENYARELFELHTIGAKNYYNHLYNDWKKVPKNEAGIAIGYIDEDVYEAARAFTGWTFGNGESDYEMEMPNTGEFYYYDQWHDQYQKRVLGVEFKSHQTDLADGKKVLDLVCYHAATAINICTKLCQWFVADNPPQSIIDKAVNIWTTNAQAEDQILRVVEMILVSTEFADNLNSKIKRPNHLIFSLAKQFNLKPNLDWLWFMQEMGWKQFSWAVPTGHPDNANYWLNTDMMLKRWNSLPILLYINMENGNNRQLSNEVLKLSNTHIETIIEYWAKKLLGKKLTKAVADQMALELLKDMEDMKTQEWSILAKDYPDELEYKLIQTVSMLVLTPDFHKR